MASNGNIEAGSALHYYHLVKPVDDHQFPSNKSSERTHKAIPEIFLTRLLSTKGTIQKFVDDFFTTILTVNEDLPPAVKWLFDLFDEASRKHNIADPEVVHAWKSNRYIEISVIFHFFHCVSLNHSLIIYPLCGHVKHDTIFCLVS